MKSKTRKSDSGDHNRSLLNSELNINWFPGHMAKTRRIICDQMKLVDSVVIVLDARIPVSSCNPEIESITAGKPKIIIFNKADLADKTKTNEWIAYYKSKDIVCIPANCKTGEGLKGFRSAVKSVLADVIKRNTERGMPGKPLRLMVLGIPNTGKSTFINRMYGGAKAKTEDRAGVTRQNQWYIIGGGIELLDTPGVLWPKFEDPSVGERLAFTGGMRDNIVDPETLAVRFLGIMRDDYPERLAERYKISDFEDKEPIDILEMIGRKRGLLVKGGEVDTQRAAGIVLDEYRAGLLGKITFESINYGNL